MAFCLSYFGTLCCSLLTISFSEFLGCRPFDSPTADINYRTLWIFINSAFEDDFAPYRAAHLLREIFQLCYARLTDLIAISLGETPDDYIKVEVIEVWSLFYYFKFFFLS